MLVTLADGVSTKVFDTEKRRVMGTVRVFDGYRHGLRLHIYNPSTRDASEKFVTYDQSLQDEIMSAIRAEYGHINHTNTWVKPVVKRQEFWDESRERAIVLKDLQRFFGNNVTIRGNSIRYIHYVSDGRLENTPDAIGVMFRKPLVYSGLAVATVFDIAGKDPLRPGYNVVHWLTKHMWHGFHDRFRKIPKDFPWPTGFVCSYWCQREGYGTYDGNIRIASMTQGQSVGRWAATSLRQYWIERNGGKDIFAEFGQSFKVDRGKKKSGGSKLLAAMAYAQAGITPLGKVGLYCAKCGSLLSEIYGVCTDEDCGYVNSTYDLANKVMCTLCGKQKSQLCSCGDPYCSESVVGCQCSTPVFKKTSLAENKSQLDALTHGPNTENGLLIAQPSPIIIGG